GDFRGTSRKTSSGRKERDSLELLGDCWWGSRKTRCARKYTTARRNPADIRGLGREPRAGGCEGRPRRDGAGARPTGTSMRGAAHAKRETRASPARVVGRKRATGADRGGARSRPTRRGRRLQARARAVTARPRDGGGHGVGARRGGRAVARAAAARRRRGQR